MDERSARIERFFAWPLVIAGLAVIPVLVVQESDLGSPWTTIAAAANWAIWIAFATEFVIMLAVVPSRRRWLAQHPLDIVVVFLTPPFLPPALQALRVLRVVAVFRARRVRSLLSLDGIRYSAVLVTLVVIAGGTAISDVEGGIDSTWDGIWFAFQTVTTVGYGDVVPTTVEGRVIAIGIMFAGIGFVSLLTAFVAERFINVGKGGEESGRRAADDEILTELREIRKRLERLERR